MTSTGGTAPRSARRRVMWARSSIRKRVALASTLRIGTAATIRVPRPRSSPQHSRGRSCRAWSTRASRTALRQDEAGATHSAIGSAPVAGPPAIARAVPSAKASGTQVPAARSFACGQLPPEMPRAPRGRSPRCPRDARHISFGLDASRVISAKALPGRVAAPPATRCIGGVHERRGHDLRQMTDEGHGPVVRVGVHPTHRRRPTRARTPRAARRPRRRPTFHEEPRRPRTDRRALSSAPGRSPPAIGCPPTNDARPASRAAAITCVWSIPCR